MAECQVKLPLELLGDGEKKSCWGNEHGFPCGFPYDMGSDLSSPLSSTSETGSDEDEDYLDGLTRQMAHSFLLDDDDKDPRNICSSKASGIMATSPQSTLCDVGLWSGSGTTSPNGRSLSPPLTAAAAAATTVDVLYSAAGHVALTRLQAQAEAEKLYGRGPLAHPRNNYYLKQQQFEHLKLQQKPTDGEAGWSLGTAEQGWAEPRPVGRCCRPLGLPPSAWPPLQGRQHTPPPPPPSQQQHHQELVTARSRMRAAFLQSGGRRTSNGTGVFLPQRSGNHAQSRKKPAVLLPARVVQALNLNLEDMGRHPHLPGTFVLDGAILSRGNALNRSHVIRSQPPFAVAATAAAAHEVRLPAEWTY